jgi:small subunit ribosomal protein S20
MANHKSAKKRVKISEKRRQNNKASLTKVKTLIKNVLDSKEKETAEVKLKDAVAYIDRVAVKGRIHQNNAARKKSRLTKFVNSLAK